MRFTEFISEAGSPAQQAAIAIAMKKAGKKPKDVAEGSLNELSSDLLKRAAQAATDKRNQAMEPELHNALGGGYMNPLATHYDNVSQKINNRAAQVKRKETIQKIASKIASPAVMRKMGMSGVAEGAPELLKQEMPLVRHIEQELAQHGYEKGTPEYDQMFKHTMSMYRKFGNVDAIKQGVAEGLPGSLSKSDYTPGATVKNPNTSCKRCHGRGTLWKAPDGKILPANDVPGAKKYKCGACDGIGMAKKEVDEGENWSKHNNPRAGGMSKKSVSSYRRSHPGSKIQTAVTTKPSKLKKGSKAAKRRASFCARMRGMKKHRTGAKTARDPNSNINKSLRRWHCESIEELHELVMLAEQYIRNNKK